MPIPAAAPAESWWDVGGARVFERPVGEPFEEGVIVVDEKEGELMIVGEVSEDVDGAVVVDTDDEADDDVVVVEDDKLDFAVLAEEIWLF